MRALVLVACWSTSAFAADAVDWKKTLEEPASPGNLAVLVEHGDAPDVQMRWREGLKDPAVEVRAAAARAIYASGRADLAKEVAAQLAQEADDTAAEEQMRALASMGDPESDGVLIEAARRFPRLRPLAGNLLGRARGPEAVRYHTAFADFDDTGTARRCLFQGATRGGRDPLDRVAEQVLRAGDATSWEAVWAVALQGGRMTDDLIAAGMTSPSPRIRATTYWHAAMFLREDLSLSAPFKRALKSAPEAERAKVASAGGRDEADAAFAFELMRRARGEKTREDLDWVRGLPDGPQKPSLPGPLWRISRHFTKGEHAVLAEKQLLRAIEEAGTGRPFPAQSVPLHTLDETTFPARYLSELLRQSGCDQSHGFEATVEYTREGRPQNVTLLAPNALTPACAESARILFRSAYHLSWMDPADTAGLSSEPQTRTVQISLPLDAASAGGLVGGSVAEDAVDEPVRVGGNIKEPNKLVHVNPRYPANARRARAQGLVIIEAMIGKTGKVESVRLLRGVDALSEAAMDAVRQWVYTPTLLNGRPVPVYMTVTVAFSLR